VILFWMLVLIALGTMVAWSTIFAARRGGFGADESHGVQKVHVHWVPRLGGIPVFFTFVAGCLLWEQLEYISSYSAFALVLCSLPAFLIGLMEDISRNVSVIARLLVTMGAAALGWYFLNGQLRRLDIPMVDHLLAYSALASFALTAVAVGGVAHAINIIDGYNGLSGIFALLAFSAIGLVAYQQGDSSLAHAAILAALSQIGFLIWNYPMGRLFLGDAGAYFVGFLIAEFSILLVTRNPEVSPWCAMLIVIYPVWETLFSIYRRAATGGWAQIGRADALHLHHLVFRRLINSKRRAPSPATATLRNAATTLYLIPLVLLSVVPAVLFADQAGTLFGFCVLFAVSYVVIYLSIIRLRVPRWLVIRPSFDQRLQTFITPRHSQQVVAKAPRRPASASDAALSAADYHGPHSTRSN